MKKIIISSLCIISLITHVFGYSSLRVGDPRTTWYTYQGTIEDASISVKPKGLYMEYGMYLTFSARSTPFANTDSLEVVFTFDLPENAIVTDSWLWIGDTISRAKIMDRWTASAVYENIVNRRQDPSILTKQSNTQYQLRVFPMQANATRKVKITYLVPTTWNQNTVTAKLPLNLLNTSYNVVPNVELITWCDAVWNNPKIKGYPSMVFTQYTNATFGNYWHTPITSAYYNSDINIQFKSPMTDGVYLSTFSDASDKYYQLAISPSVMVGSSHSKKVTFLIDYDQSKTSYSKTSIIASVKQAILDNMRQQDSFNLIFSNFNIYRVSNTWISADSLTVENIFAALNNPLSNYSNLSPLIANGIDFVTNQGNNGKIVLLSSSDQYGSSTVANNLVNDIVSMMNPDIPFYIADYQTQNATYYYINGMYYYGNGYFYRTLSSITQGAYFRTLYTTNTVNDILRLNFDELGGIISSFNLYTYLGSGYCFGRYNINGSVNTAYMNKPILQVGKYNGSLPFKISISGEYESAIYNNELSFDPGEIIAGDSIAKAIWSGMYVKDLESQPQTNNVISSIVNKSISARVLSKYTAFLCLEDTSYFCDVCEDESVLVSLEDLASADSSLVAAPNPFADAVTIKCKKQEGIDYSSAEFMVYNLLGEVVYTFNYADIDKGDSLMFEWNGTNANGTQLDAGIYLFVIKSSEGVKRIKLIKN